MERGEEPRDVEGNRERVRGKEERSRYGARDSMASWMSIVWECGLWRKMDTELDEEDDQALPMHHVDVRC